MQKQLKNLDQELNKNGLIRIFDPQMRAQNSLFRAISMAVFYSHSEYQKVASFMKLCLLCFSQLHSQSNPFPSIPSRSRYLLKFKFSENTQLLSDYLNNPDLDCFQKENLQIASVVFDRKIQVFSLDQNQYLNQSIIALGKSANSNNNKQKTIMLAKVSNRYYCVLTQQKQKLVGYLKDYIMNQIISNLSSLPSLVRSNSLNSSSVGSKQGRVHFPNYDQSHSRQHKKSLSDCGQRDLTQSNMNINLINKNLVNPNLSRKFMDGEGSDQQNLPNPPPLTQTQSFQGQQSYYNNHNSNQMNYEPYMQQQNSPYGYYGNHQEIDYYLDHQNNSHLAKSMNFSPTPGLYKAHSMMNSLNSNSPTHQYEFRQSPSTTPFQNDSLSINSSLVPMKNNGRYTGRLKFFDQNKNYGFIIVDIYNQDIFVHLDDLSKAGIPKEGLKSNIEMRFQFTCLQYDGKNKNRKSKKAVQLILISDYSI